MATKKKMLQAAAGVGGEPEGAWDLSYAYYDDPFAWDVSTAVYANTSFNVAGQESSPHGVSFKPDGTKMYVLGVAGDDVNEYDLSTAWDVSTASYLQNFSVSAQETSPYGLFFKPDGTKMYIAGSAGDDVSEYDLSTAWDISSASFLQNFSVSAQETGISGLFFKPDGTKMYVIGISGDDVNEYDLSTAWDISTASYLQNFSVATNASNPEDVFFKPDGTVMYIAGRNNDNVAEYNLSTAWDVSTASYVQDFSVAAQETTPTGIFFKPDGTALYVVGTLYDTVYQYTLGGFSVYDRERIPSDVFFKPDGTEMYIIGLHGDDVNQYTLSTAWDTSTATYTRVFDTGTVTTAPQGLYFKPDGTTLYTVGDSTRALAQWSLSVPWDISSTSYVRQFSVSAQMSAPKSVTFKPDGTKMYFAGANDGEVNEYALSSAWDISSASYVQNFSIAAQETAVQGVFFKTNGTKMYILGRTGDDVNEYDLSTAWDVSSASYVQNFSIASEESTPSGLFFKEDGTQMFVVGESTDKVFTYSLGVQE